MTEIDETIADIEQVQLFLSSKLHKLEELIVRNKIKIEDLKAEISRRNTSGT